MPRHANFRSIVLYSVISAAFIGPGTITTTLTAGSLHGLRLLWAVTLSIAGCLILQEISARLVIGTGMSLAEAAGKAFGKSGKLLLTITGMAIILGCAAYEAGNILGAVSGLNLLTGINTRWLTAAVTAAAFLLLWLNRRSVIAGTMTALVALMGLTFMWLALQQPYSVTEVLYAATVPQFPQGSALLILGLVGTTIVPYNIFLGSGISRGRPLHEMRAGLAVSVLTGGFITGAVLIAGTSVVAFASFPELANLLAQQVGYAGSLALGIGLFAAGFSSSVTAPYAAVLVTATLTGKEDKTLRWIWMGVLGAGFLFGISGIKPIPVILTVQALNGFILPLLAALLMVLVNHGKILPRELRPGLLYRIAMLAVFGCVTLVGLNQAEKTLITTGWLPGENLWILVAVSAVLAALLGYLMKRYAALT
ncbi:MAG: manganese transporter [Cyclobacteriaceae bacterium]|nr:MAG: manganese transporter [Cyclobacteriaceae bacterium]